MRFTGIVVIGGHRRIALVATTRRAARLGILALRLKVATAHITYPLHGSLLSRVVAPQSIPPNRQSVSKQLSVHGYPGEGSGLRLAVPPGPMPASQATHPRASDLRLCRAGQSSLGRCVADLRLWCGTFGRSASVQLTPSAGPANFYQSRELSVTVIALWVDVARLQPTCSGPMYLVGSLSSCPRSHSLPGGMCLVQRQQ